MIGSKKEFACFGLSTLADVSMGKIIIEICVNVMCRKVFNQK